MGQDDARLPLLVILWIAIKSISFDRWIGQVGQTFFSRTCNKENILGGAYRLLWQPDGEERGRGEESCKSEFTSEKLSSCMDKIV